MEELLPLLRLMSGVNKDAVPEASSTALARSAKQTPAFLLFFKSLALLNPRIKRTAAGIQPLAAR